MKYFWQINNAIANTKDISYNSPATFQDAHVARLKRAKHLVFSKHVRHNLRNLSTYAKRREDFRIKGAALFPENPRDKNLSPKLPARS